jgi:hypothetical protein
MLRLAQSCSCSFLIPNRHWYEPSDLREEGERSQSSDFFGSHAPVENENENEDDWKMGRLVRGPLVGDRSDVAVCSIVLMLVLDP